MTQGKWDLSQGWKICHTPPEWSVNEAMQSKTLMPADLPCDVHMPLLANGLIEEPLVAMNANLCDWIVQKAWWFNKTFDVTSDHLSFERLELTLDGLDCQAYIYLNGQLIGEHRNSFFPFIKNIKDRLHLGQNALWVRITSGLDEITQEQHDAIYPFVNTPRDMGYPERSEERRALLRKPQYVFGWDWAPCVPTIALWDAYISCHGAAAIRNVHATTLQIQPAIVQITVETQSFWDTTTLQGSLQVDWTYQGKTVTSLCQDVLITPGFQYHTLKMEVPNAQLWWPSGMGDASLYQIRVTLLPQNLAPVDYPPFGFGIRTLTVDTRRETDRNRFQFVVNGVPMFCKGANYIPSDSIYARVTKKRKVQLLDEAQNAEMNMLRIWGGGLYETDDFYDLCDQRGILIWQDFMFACSLVPDTDPVYVQSVTAEAEYQTRRLRNHACLAIWCGNNENVVAFVDWYRDKNPPEYLGKRLYNEVLPKIVQQNCPQTFYWNSSPFGGMHPADMNCGDVHPWGEFFMHWDMQKRITPQVYDTLFPSFVSEFGIVGPTLRKSLEQYMGDAPLDRQSAVWHNHTNTFELKTVAAGIAKHYTDDANLSLDDYLLYAGLVQGQLYGYALESLRFQPQNSGALFWMYNDAWGEIGWSILDYYLRRKISFAFVRRAFAPRRLIMRKQQDKTMVTLCNDTPHPVQIEAEIGFITFDGQKCQTKTNWLTAQPHQRAEAFEMTFAPEDASQGVFYVWPKGETDILPATLYDLPIRDCRIPKPQLEASVHKENDKTIVTVCCQTYAHAVHFDLPDGILVSDEYFDLLPGQCRTVVIDGKIKDDIAVKCV